MNPFRFGDPVTGYYYLKRAELNKILVDYLGAKINIVLIGPRRFGKTSFVLNLLSEIKMQGLTEGLHVDLFSTTSH